MKETKTILCEQRRRKRSNVTFIPPKSMQLYHKFVSNTHTQTKSKSKSRKDCCEFSIWFAFIYYKYIIKLSIIFCRFICHTLLMIWHSQNGFSTPMFCFCTNSKRKTRYIWIFRRFISMKIFMRNICMENVHLWFTFMYIFNMRKEYAIQMPNMAVGINSERALICGFENYKHKLARVQWKIPKPHLEAQIIPKKQYLCACLYYWSAALWYFA